QACVAAGSDDSDRDLAPVGDEYLADAATLHAHLATSSRNWCESRHPGRRLRWYGFPGRGGWTVRRSVGAEVHPALLRRVLPDVVDVRRDGIEVTQRVGSNRVERGVGIDVDLSCRRGRVGVGYRGPVTFELVRGSIDHGREHVGEGGGRAGIVEDRVDVE